MTAVRPDVGLPYARRVRDLVRDGKVGTVTHISCDDRRAGDVVAAESHLVAVAVDQLADLAQLLDARPTRLMVRSEPARTEAFLELDNGLRVQYSGAASTGVTGHELWIDGDLGALRVAWGRLWWRKRGWRWFIPLGLGKLQADPDRLGDPASRAAAILAAAVISDRDATVAPVVIPDPSGATPGQALAG